MASTGLIIGLSVGLAWVCFSAIVTAVVVIRRRHKPLPPAHQTLIPWTDSLSELAPSSIETAPGQSTLGIASHFPGHPYFRPAGSSFQREYSSSVSTRHTRVAGSAFSLFSAGAESSSWAPFETVAPRDVEYGPNPGIFPLAAVPREIHPVISAMASTTTADGEILGHGGQGARTPPSLSPDPPLRMPDVPLPVAVPGTLPNIYQCEKCPLSFDKAYLLNKHNMRKHERRYKCNDCDSPFALRADLLRHERSLHGSGSGSGAGAGVSAINNAESFVCSNPNCKTPSKTFNRKDNFMRHSARCAANADRGASASASTASSSEVSPQSS